MKKTAIITFIIAVVLITVTLLGNATNHKKVVDSTSKSSKFKISAAKKQSITSKSQSSSLISSSSAAIDQSVNEDSSSSTSSSVANDPNTASYNPNKTAQGTEVTAEMITKVRQELIRAGLPADKWGPSDIKKIITESSQQNMSVIVYAKANYHQ
ncbi:hypothetical protein [Leuconostoc pseudomesenteroides]|uniref:hypothetical protein n=1 Tax=Leuconostoc pseudomesenteroides TaxID=33968 RepID=UPI00228690F7|nr:hypothetical protein [Leuconostoc pseudomesenteroides]WAM37956.1 hypothetical protein OYT93_07030 [Leuconostoc pseudomesenteroides]